MNYKRHNNFFFVEAGILLLPNPPFRTRLIFPQVPLIDGSMMFSIQSSPIWIEEKRSRNIVLTLEEKLFFCLKQCRIDHMNDCKMRVTIMLRIQTTYLRGRDIRM